MGRLICPMGQYATIPYFVKNVGVHAYSIEELCYIISENAFVLDDSLVDRELAMWIDTQCGLQELAKSLYSLINQNGSPGAIAGTILDYTSFATPEKVKYIENILKTGVSLNIYEKKKNHADYLAKNKKYSLAISEYDALLKELPKSDAALQSDIIYSKGVALTGLFLMEEAATEFFSAYRLNPMNSKALKSYLMAVRLTCTEEEYITFAAEHENWHEQLLQVEEKLNNVEREWVFDPEYLELRTLIEEKSGTMQKNYYDEIHRRIQTMKYEYKERTLD